MVCSLDRKVREEALKRFVLSTSYISRKQVLSNFPIFTIRLEINENFDFHTNVRLFTDRIPRRISRKPETRLMIGILMKDYR